eukprot:scaffold3797_cov91-Skeletonema_dohrnii-CCMP3373.AAC.17
MLLRCGSTTVMSAITLLTHLSVLHSANRCIIVSAMSTIIISQDRLGAHTVSHVYYVSGRRRLGRSYEFRRGYTYTNHNLLVITVTELIMIRIRVPILRQIFFTYVSKQRATSTVLYRNGFLRDRCGFRHHDSGAS